MSTEMKVETAQKNAFQSRLDRTQSEIDLLNDENRNWKQLYYDMKRKVTNQSWTSGPNDVINSEVTSSFDKRRQSLGQASLGSHVNSTGGNYKTQLEDNNEDNSSKVSLPLIENAFKNRD